MEQKGLKFDRRWMLTDKQGRFLTARRFPTLLAIKAGVLNQHIELQFPTGENVLLDSSQLQNEVVVTIWQSEVKAMCSEPEVNRIFSDYLGMDCQLVYQADDQTRAIDANHAMPGENVSFADGFPLLLATESSLLALQQKLDFPIDMRRFRPNLVLGGIVRPFIEQGWKRIRIGDCVFRVSKPCTRCILTTVNPETASKDPHRKVLDELAKMNANEEGTALFGVNLVPETTSSVHMGDELEVLV